MDAVAGTLLPMIEKLYPNGHRFIHDNDPKHTSAKARQFIIDHRVNWWHTPPESPDCNPIESMWHEMKENLRREVKPQNKEELIEGILSFWLTLQLRHLLLCQCQTFKIVHGIDCINFSDFFAFKQRSLTSHPYSLSIPKSRINAFRFSYFVNAPFVWNQLPSPILESSSLFTFKFSLSKLLLNIS